MDQTPPYITPQPRRTGWIVYSVIATFLLFLSLMGCFILFTFAFGGRNRASVSEGSRSKYEEEYVQGKSSSRNKIAVIRLTGIIGESEGLTGEEGIVPFIKNQLDQALEDEHVKAIVLRINSPGGEVVASDEIYRAVAEAREKKKIVASMETVGASGAYYAAMGADYVMANDLTITGSIGVILQSFTFAGLMDKVGVKSYTFKSGKYKDILNPTREPTAGESNMVQNLIMEVYDKFVGIVAKERKMDVDELKNGLADGRILSGKQAKEAGFIDGLGYFDDAVDKAKELAGIEDAKVVRYVAPFSLRNVLRFLGENDRTKVQIQLSPVTFKLESGKLYFLPAYMYQ
jgi:protease-4